MEIVLNNPAGRLVLLLLDIQRMDGGNVGDSFCAALKIPKGNFVEMVSQQQAWHKTIDDVSRRLRSSRNGHLVALYEEQTGRKLKLLLTPGNLSSPWNNFKAEFFRDEFVTNLFIYSAILAKSAPEKELREDEIENMIKDLNTIYDSVSNSAVESELKDLILDGLEDLRRAIHEYRIRGIAGIEAAISRNLANALAASRRPESALQKYAEFIKVAAAHATFYHYMSPAIPEFLKLLTPGSS
jgi:hypothetical protein